MELLKNYSSIMLGMGIVLMIGTSIFNWIKEPNLYSMFLFIIGLHQTFHGITLKKIEDIHNAL